MKVKNREENHRIHREMERFYAAHPEYRVQANHQIFIDAAEQDGGSEVLTAEWMALQLDSLPLGVLGETPDQAFEKFFQEHPEYNFEANRIALARAISPRPVTSENLNVAFKQIGGQLPFDSDVRAEQAAQREVDERAELIEFISKRYSRDPQTQQMEAKKSLGAGTQYLRDRAAQLRLNSEMRNRSTEELRKLLNANLPEPASLPPDITAEVIRNATPEQIRRLADRYGYDLLNQRLGYVKPEIAGNIRTIHA